MVCIDPQIWRAGQMLIHKIGVRGKQVVVNVTAVGWTCTEFLCIDGFIENAFLYTIKLIMAGS